MYHALWFNCSLFILGEYHISAAVVSTRQGK